MADPKELAAEILPKSTLREALPHLRRPFSPEAIKFRPAAGGLVLAYIDARVVIERLNVVAPEWQTRFEILPTGKQVACHLTISDRTRSDVGTMGAGPNVDPVKAGYSDALKRAAVHFGVGVSVYALKRINESDLPAGSTKKNAKDKTYITDKGETALRRGYRKWLESAHGKHFGPELAHGDVEGSVGDPEAAPGGVAAEPVDPPHDYTELLDEIMELYKTLTPAQRKGFGPAKFKANLKAAGGSEADLKKLKAEIGKRAAK